MRKLAIVMALASTALASPALARDKSWYVGVEGGAMIIEDLHFSINGTPNASTVDHHYGYDVDGNIGYDFGAFRVEAEVGYRSATVSGYRSTIRTPDYLASGALTSQAPGSFSYAGGRSSALSFMVNGMLDFGDDDGIQGFVGGGVGVARVKERLGLNTNGPSYFLNDSDTRFAYQGIAGVRAPLGPHLDAVLKYRYFNASRVALVDVTNGAYNTRFRSHAILGGISYNFGEPPAPPPPPVVTPPPPPPPTVTPPPPPPPVCAPGPYIVFFEWDKSDITPEAASILDNAVSQYQQGCASAQVMLAGFTDTSGTPKYNIALGQRRADSVKAYLTAHGIADGSVQTQSFGEDPSHLRVQTANNVREVQNRRVEIMYGPGSGQ